MSETQGVWARGAEALGRRDAARIVFNARTVERRHVAQVREAQMKHDGHRTGNGKRYTP